VSPSSPLPTAGTPDDGLGLIEPARVKLKRLTIQPAGRHETGGHAQ
jgi:hypothetical protein